jgi:hypothetical protein
MFRNAWLGREGGGVVFRLLTVMYDFGTFSSKIGGCLYVKGKVKVSLQQAIKAQRGSRGITLLFL